MHFNRNLSRRSAITAATAAVGSAFVAAPALAQAGPDQLPVDPGLPVDPDLPGAHTCRIIALELVLRGLALVDANGTSLPFHDVSGTIALLLGIDLAVPAGQHGAAEMTSFSLLGYSPRSYSLASDPLADSANAGRASEAAIRPHPSRMRLKQVDPEPTTEAAPPPPPPPGPTAYEAEFAFPATDAMFARTESGIVTLTSAEPFTIDMVDIAGLLDLDIDLNLPEPVETDLGPHLGDLAFVDEAGEAYTLTTGDTTSAR